jgi:hypothetical protein
MWLSTFLIIWYHILKKIIHICLNKIDPFKRGVFYITPKIFSILKKISRKIFVKFGNNPYTCFMSKELYSEIEDLIIRWSNDGDKTAGHLTRQIMESLSNEKHKHVIIDLRNMDYFKDKEGKIIHFDTLEEACDVCGMYEFEDSWVMRLMYNHRENGEVGV